MRFLLDHALERIARATRRLRHATRGLDRDLVRSLEDEGALAVALDPTEVDRLGWCLGVLAASRGADLLRERREREGLAHFVAFVGEALGVTTFVPDVARLPRLSTEAGRGWEVPLVVGWLVFAVARARPGQRLEWRFDADAGRARLALATRGWSAEERRALVRAGRELGVLARETRWEPVGEDVVVALPRRWFES